MNIVPMNLSSDVRFIIDTLNESGHRADVVGGAVRDHLIGSPSYDYDITTSATPDEVKTAFANGRIIDTGLKHGTVTLMLDGVGYEITTWRVDGEYLDSRHPEEVIFTRSLEEDLARRDFTINAICYNPKDGFTDLFGGFSDIDAGIIRAVGDPERRFNEDALRILRAVRFSATLGFSLDENTAKSAIKLRKLVNRVSEERIYTELKRMLSAPYAHGTLSSYPEIILTVLPELTSLHIPDENAFKNADYLTRLLAIFHINCADPRDSFSAAMRRLKTDNLIRTSGEAVLLALRELKLEKRYDYLMLLNALGEELARAAVEVGILAGELSEASREALTEAKSSDIPYRLSELSIGGKDLLALGIKGVEIGKTLSRLLDAVMREECKNTPEDLKRYIDLCQNQG